MFLITAEGINVLRATQIFIKVHRRSKCWCTMGKVSDKKVQRRASHKKEGLSEAICEFSDPMGSESKSSHLALPDVKEGQTIHFYSFRNTT
jgi:hypothetical protein